MYGTGPQVGSTFHDVQAAGTRGFGFLSPDRLCVVERLHRSIPYSMIVPPVEKVESLLLLPAQEEGGRPRDHEHPKVTNMSSPPSSKHS
ncbi:hypothetical protein CaCOL14_004377 [Colletotrichum acutatum]